ncbi:MAG TPA: hypothetical protein VMF65_09010 [Acidimicrobiales bacterium]|nr:hypothetical protein [Acidimicrobiales bacterium]
MSGLARYIAADTARSQRWLPPLLVYAVFCAFNLAADGSAAGNALPTMATAAAALLPISIWLTVVVGNCEDPVQATITAATVGGEARLRLAKLLVALMAAAALGLISTVLAWLGTNNFGLTDFRALGAGLAAHLLAAVVGVAAGAWCMRPILDRRAWAVLTGLAVTMVEVLVPHCPPVRQFLVLFGPAEPAHLAAGIALIAVQSVGIAAVLVTGALRWGQAHA